MPKFQVFPSLESPDDHRKGKHALRLHPTLPPTAPASAPDPSVLEKTKGHFDRRELISVVRESEKKPLSWPEHNLLQVRREWKDCSTERYRLSCLHTQLVWESYSRHCKSTSHQILLFRFLTNSFNSFSIINLHFITSNTRGKTLQFHLFQGIYN